MMKINEDKTDWYRWQRIIDTFNEFGFRPSWVVSVWEPYAEQDDDKGEEEIWRIKLSFAVHILVLWTIKAKSNQVSK